LNTHGGCVVKSGKHRSWDRCQDRVSNHRLRQAEKWLLLLPLHGCVCKSGRHRREVKRRSRERWDLEALAKERLVGL
jgi:hypothetical protein